MRKTIDIEGALASMLAADGYDAGAPPVPADLSAGRVQVTRTGGTRSDFVIDEHSIDFDCYGSTDAAAMGLADALTAWACELPGRDVGVPCYQADIVTLPYSNPDPRHPTLARATLKARILTRVSHTD